MDKQRQYGEVVKVVGKGHYCGNYGLVRSLPTYVEGCHHIGTKCYHLTLQLTGPVHYNCVHGFCSKEVEDIPEDERASAAEAVNKHFNMLRDGLDNQETFALNMLRMGD
jgi:hypothetical protein